MAGGPPMPDENGLACAPAVARVTSRRLGTRASAVSLTWEHSAPRTVAFEHAEQSCERERSSGPRLLRGGAMERQIERGCGLDVHRDTVAACVRVPGRGRPREQHVRTFGTTAAELWQL